MRELCQTMENFRNMAEKMDVVLFGAGEYCMRFMNCIGDMTERVRYIIDNNVQKSGEKLYGKPICGPEKLKELAVKETLVIITVDNSIPQIYSQIRSLGEFPIMTARILLNGILEDCARELYKNEEMLKKVKTLLYDDKSREIYEEAVRRRMLYGECDFSDLVVKGDCEYRIPLMFRESEPQEEVILDCGAYNGDTLRKFVNTFGPRLKRIYAFECMEESLAKLEKAAELVQNGKYVPDIKIMPYGLSDHEGEMVLAKTCKPNGSFLESSRLYAKKTLDIDGYETVKVGTIDTLIPEEEKVTLIKMDIEGSEYEALKGSIRTIRKWKPRLAISIYHSGKDYFRLPLLVKEMVPEYKIAVRHHNKNHCDTDMYCWI